MKIRTLTGAAALAAVAGFLYAAGEFTLPTVISPAVPVSDSSLIPQPPSTPTTFATTSAAEPLNPAGEPEWVLSMAPLTTQPPEEAAWGGVSAMEPPNGPGEILTPPAGGEVPVGEPATDATAAEQPAGWPPAPGGYDPRGCVDCINSDRLEGEPVCANGYVDTFNGGCNSTPNVFGEIDCGQTVCGEYGTFLSAGGSNFRDTDWYHFTLIQPANVTWTATGEARTRVFILQGTCPATSLGTAVADACLPATVTLNNLAPGTYSAFVGTDAFTGVACGSRYRATLTVDPCCVGPCQPGDLIESEPRCADGYVDAFNGGCNASPNVFGEIDCGQTVCGEYGTFLSSGGANFRDTDWYQFTLPQPANVTWTAVGQARTRVFILQGTCPASSLGTAVADACLPATVTINNLAAGTYSVFVGTDVFTGVPCGSRYRATLTADPCCVGPCEPGDLVEGEPLCSDGYVDAFNGGCNSTPNAFGLIDCGLTVCGQYGTFLSSGGANFRDTDWYHFTITQTSNVVWSAVGQARTRVFILQGTCPASSLGTAVADPCLPATVSINNLAPGTYSAFVGTDAFTGVPCGRRYRATLTTTPCCPVGQQPGDLVEGETDCANGYVDAFNGGCNSSPPIFSAIACNQSVAGRYGTYLSAGGASFRDTDWYRFTLPAPSDVTWTVTGEARTRAFILNAACPASSLGTAVADPCLPATVTLTGLAAGTYYAFAGTDAFTGVACGSRYRATLTTSTCSPPCDPDVNCDGAVNGFDVEATEQAINGDFSNFCQPSADLNGDGAENGFDIETEEQRVNGAPC
ncbi:hypothetical protein PHYC_00240 [Phycisphaerales bacterium]|nr:hypothetical protein PHYC_00240 [Phycisphaerales bacterium]